MFLSRKIVSCIVCILSVSNLSAQSFQTLQSLIARRFPAMDHKVIFHSFQSTVTDTANYFAKNDKLVINANSINAASYALYDYVKKYCHSSLSHTGDNVQIPASLPETKHSESVSATFPLRYALNYCTYNYTMSFWNWEQWEKELDWMSLNGVNLMLAPIGTEEVWQKTLQQLGFSDKEIRAFIPGPAFNAWWLMGNLEGWGGPVSDAMIQHWTSLQQKILTRMKALHIQPVVQAFTGLVPSTLKNHFPNAAILEQGLWCGFQRPSVLLAKDSLYNKIAALYYNNFKKLYGDNFHYLGGDLFHEGGKTKGVNLTEEGKLVQQNMQQYFPNATWILQGWQDNPKPKMLEGLDASHTLIIDLLGDRTDTWLQRNQYNNFPWIWSTISNFGGKTTTGGTLMRIYSETDKAQRIYGSNSLLKGTGIIPEGIENNAIIYQWALVRAWQKNTQTSQDNLNAFITARYGTNNAYLTDAWQYLLQTIYDAHEPGIPGGQGGYESIFCARPDTSFITTTSCCGPEKLWFDADVLTQAAINFSKAAPQLQAVPAFQYDLVDTWRQVINLKARMVYEKLMQAIRDKNKTAFETDKKLFVQLLLLQDKWLGTNSFFRVGKWINEAKNLLPDSSDKKLCEWNARTQITYWGPADRTTFLHEYANKEWQGILQDLYLPRWEKFFDYAENLIDNKQPIYPDFFSMEKNWSEAQNDYNAAPEGNSETMLPQLMKVIAQSFAHPKTIDFFNDK